MGTTDKLCVSMRLAFKFKRLGHSHLVSKLKPQAKTQLNVLKRKQREPSFKETFRGYCFRKLMIHGDQPRFRL